MKILQYSYLLSEMNIQFYNALFKSRKYRAM